MADVSFVEDTKGHVVPVTIMNPSPGHACYISGASLKELFPLGCVLAIREPYVRFAVNGNVAVRVDVPSDVIVLHHSHPLIQDLRWAYPPVVSPLAPHSADDRRLSDPRPSS